MKKWHGSFFYSTTISVSDNDLVALIEGFDEWTSFIKMITLVRISK
jgi:hypothetical protein